jgi:hypothetical protein
MPDHEINDFTTPDSGQPQPDSEITDRIPKNRPAPSAPTAMLDTNVIEKILKTYPIQPTPAPILDTDATDQILKDHAIDPGPVSAPSPPPQATPVAENSPPTAPIQPPPIQQAPTIVPVTPGETRAQTVNMPPGWPTQFRRKRSNLWWLAVILIAVLILILIIMAVTANARGSAVVPANNVDNAPRTVQVGQNAILVFKAHSSNISVHTGNGDAVLITPRNHGSTVAPDPASVHILYGQDHDAQGRDRLTITTDPWFKDVDFVVTMPTTTAVQISVDSGSLDIHGGQGVIADTRSGSVALDTVQGPVDVHTDSGDVTANDLAGPTKIQAENGSLKLLRLKGPVNALTTSGDVLVREATLSGSSMLQTHNGSVRFTGSLDSQGSYDMQTFSGDVDLTLPDNTAFALTAQTGSGSVQNAFGGPNVGAIPQPPLSLHTQNGSIVITKVK